MPDKSEKVNVARCDTDCITRSCAVGLGKYGPNTLSPVCLSGMEVGILPFYDCVEEDLTICIQG